MWLEGFLCQLTHRWWVESFGVSSTVGHRKCEMCNQIKYKACIILSKIEIFFSWHRLKNKAHCSLNLTHSVYVEFTVYCRKHNFHPSHLNIPVFLFISCILGWKLNEILIGWHNILKWHKRISCMNLISFIMFFLPMTGIT